MKAIEEWKVSEAKKLYYCFTSVVPVDIALDIILIDVMQELIVVDHLQKARKSNDPSGCLL